MPRRCRLDLPGIPQHIVQRGNNRGACFFCDDDRVAYLDRLNHHAGRLSVEVHAYVLMTNHVHLLATPQRNGAASTLMEDLGRDYVRLVNCAHRRSGTLWEGRFHSCLVDTDRYLLACMRYIESNPSRAGMVIDAAHYRWSSFQTNAFGQASTLLVPHEVYRALGANALERCAAYRVLFASACDPADEDALRLHTRQRAAWGSLEFQRKVGSALGRRVTASAPGRPRRNLDNGI